MYRKEYAHEYYLKNKERIKARDREKYAPIKEANRIKREKAKEERQKYLEEHGEEIRQRRLEYQKEYQKQNRERLNAYRREWYHKNPERCKAAMKRWQDKKKEEKKTSEYFKTVAQIIEQLEKEEMKND